MSDQFSPEDHERAQRAGQHAMGQQAEGKQPLTWAAGPPEPPRTSRRGWWIFGSLVVAVFVIIGLANGDYSSNQGGGSGPAVTSASQAAAPACANGVQSGGGCVPSSQASQDSGPAVVRYDKRIVFRVWGSAADGADITYGSDSDNRSPAGGLGFDGSGTAVPWHASMRYRHAALYYSVDAQLQGSGDIKCAVIARVTAYYSDGSHVSKQRRLATGHASGSYNVCSAES